jgi:hypothetical protein
MRIVSASIACLAAAVLVGYGFAQMSVARLQRAFPGMAEYKAALAQGEIERVQKKVARATH